MEKFSVLMSVYYKEKPEYLKKALESVFNQTILPNEVVLVEDGILTKDLDKVIDQFNKKYSKILKVVKFKDNRGLGMALHDGINKCSNEIIFRMDTDDICNKKRFEEQIKIFEKYNVDVVGSNIIEYDEKMKSKISERNLPENNNLIIKMAKKRNPINHMSVAYKKTAVLDSGNYQDMLYFEDYYLWIRMMKKGYTFYNVQKHLVKVRGGNEMIKRRGGKKYIKPILNFQKCIYKLGFINFFEYLKNITIRIIGSLVPNNMRFFLYKKVLRK